MAPVERRRMAPVAATPSIRREPRWVPLRAAEAPPCQRELARVVPPPPLERERCLPAVRPHISMLEGGGGDVCGGESGGSRSGGGGGGASGGGGEATTNLMAYLLPLMVAGVAALAPRRQLTVAALRAATLTRWRRPTWAASLQASVIEAAAPASWREPARRAPLRAGAAPWIPPTRTSTYLAHFTVPRPHRPRQHLLAVRPPLYPLPWWLAVARAAPLKQCCVSTSAPLTPPRLWRG